MGKKRCIVFGCKKATKHSFVDENGKEIKLCKKHAKEKEIVTKNMGYYLLKTK